MGGPNSGRRPESNAAKVLKGRAWHVNREAPVPPAGAVDKPAGLSASAAVVWDRIGPVCREMGTLTPADREAFRTLCTLQAALEQTTDENQVVRLANALRSYYAMFGLEPVSRSRIHVARPDEPVSKWARALA